MENKPKQLGLNCSVFERFVTENRIYVDKTQHIYNLITARNRSHFYFISRPRRFGKSLFISTLKSIFLGKKELFNEYWIGKHSDYEWSTHPVIHLDFGEIARGDVSIFKKDLGRSLDDIAEQFGITIVSTDEPQRKLSHIVKKLREQNTVVLLVDEYDKPLLGNITNLESVEEIKAVLSDFYTAVKSLEEYWRAIVITGVTKFARTSLFSGLNNLDELSFEPEVAELFGYTREELVTYFSAEIDALAVRENKTREQILDDLRMWYGGYRFCDDMQKPPMYNPLSVTECLESKRFSNYWFRTGTPSFLIALLRLRRISLEMLDGIVVSRRIFDAFEITDIPLFTALIHAGYLTIVGDGPAPELFVLDYPNREVRESFTDYLMPAFTHAVSEKREMLEANVHEKSVCQ